jgi:hypothetical protein
MADVGLEIQQASLVTFETASHDADTTDHRDA